MLNSGAESINRTPLLTIGCMFVVFAALEHLVPEPLEDELEGIFINFGCSSISEHDFIEVIKGGFRCNLVTLVLSEVSNQSLGLVWVKLTSSTS